MAHPRLTTRALNQLALANSDFARLLRECVEANPGPAPKPNKISGSKRQSAKPKSQARHGSAMSGPARFEAAPVAVARVGRVAFPPQVRGNQYSGDGSMEICHREYVADVTNVGAGFVVAFRGQINPGNAQLFPWLSTVASLYEEYQFVELRFALESDQPSTNAGSVMMAIDYDSLDAPPATKMQMMTYQNAVKGQPWTSFKLDALPRTGGRLPAGTDKSFYVAYPSGVGPVGSDLKTYNIGQIFVALSGNAAVGAVTELFVEYKIRFTKAQMLASGSTGAVSAKITTLPAATAPSTVGYTSGSLMDAAVFAVEAIPGAESQTTVISGTMPTLRVLPDNQSLTGFPVGEWIVQLCSAAATNGDTPAVLPQTTAQALGSAAGRLIASVLGTIWDNTLKDGLKDGKFASTQTYLFVATAITDVLKIFWAGDKSNVQTGHNRNYETVVRVYPAGQWSNLSEVAPITYPVFPAVDAAGLFSGHVASGGVVSAAAPIGTAPVYLGDVAMPVSSSSFHLPLGAWLVHITLTGTGLTGFSLAGVGATVAGAPPVINAAATSLHANVQVSIVDHEGVDMVFTVPAGTCSASALMVAPYLTGMPLD